MGACCTKNQQPKENTIRWQWDAAAYTHAHDEPRGRGSGNEGAGAVVGISVTLKDFTMQPRSVLPITWAVSVARLIHGTFRSSFSCFCKAGLYSCLTLRPGDFGGGGGG